MTNPTNLNYYQILDILPTASNSEIRSAYKNKALSCHPDKASQHNLTDEKATEIFRQVREAYETLSDTDKRKQYDIKISFDKPIFNAKFFNAEPSFRQAHDFQSNFHFQKTSEDDCEEYFSPTRINQDMNNVIDSDSSDTLAQFLKSKQFESSILKSIFYYACMKGKFNIVKYLIEVKKLSPNLKVFNSISFTGPIFKAAAEGGNLNLVKFFLEVHHVDIESQGLSAGTKDTALSRAAAKGHIDVVKYLISKGANLNPDISYSNILRQAINSKELAIVMLLVEAGTKINNYDLGVALERGSLDIVQYLLQKKPNIKAHQFTASPAVLAVQSGNIALVKYLEEKEGLDIFEKQRNWDDCIALLLTAAAKSKSIEMMRFLLDERSLNEKIKDNPKYIQCIFSEAVSNTWNPTKSKTDDALKFVQFLMEERKFILTKKTLEWLITDCAEYSSIEVNSYLQSYLYDSEPSKKSILLNIAKHGLVNLNLADLFNLYNSKLVKRGSYGDFSDIIYSHIQKRKITIEHLREFFLENRKSMVDALFYYSDYYYENDLSPLQLLVELGVDLNSENAEGIAAIHIAFQSGGYNKIVKFFIDNKADLSKKNKHGKTIAEILSI